MLFVQLPRQLSVRDVGRDEGRQGDTGRGGEEEGDFANSTDVLFTVFRAETEVLRRAKGEQTTSRAVSKPYL